MLANKMLFTKTIMKQRLPAAVHLTAEKVMTRLGRDSSEQTARIDDKVNVVH